MKDNAGLNMPELIEAIQFREVGDIPNALALFSSLEARYYSNASLLFNVLFHQASCWYYEALRKSISAEVKKDGVIYCANKIESIARLCESAIGPEMLNDQIKSEVFFLFGLSYLLNEQWEAAANMFSAAIRLLKDNDKLKIAIWKRFLCEAKFALNDGGCYNKLKFFYEVFVKEAAKIVDPTLYLLGERVFFLRLMAKTSFSSDRARSKKYADEGLQLAECGLSKYGNFEYVGLARYLLQADVQKS